MNSTHESIPTDACTSKQTSSCSRTSSKKCSNNLFKVSQLSPTINAANLEIWSNAAAMESTNTSMALQALVTSANEKMLDCIPPVSGTNSRIPISARHVNGIKTEKMKKAN
mmetsp:Transcript_16214/g.18671  ORF Transcript_16214/g.18671 Transcript_16214/m.18671 type:complete len:111 (-) Transcript_16214:128-460(-)